MTPPTASVEHLPIDQQPTVAPHGRTTPERKAGLPDGRAMPRAAKRSRVPTVLVVVLAALALAASAAAGVYLWVVAPGAARADLVLHKVERERLQLTIVERGQMEAANNEEITCKVKSGSKGSTVATTIKWVIDDGSHVKKGDLLATLDDSGLQEQLKTQEIQVNQASAAKIKAEEDYKITVEQGQSDVATAVSNLKIANLELSKYQEGDLEQKKKDIVGRLLIARADLDLWKDRVFWSDQMVKGRYISEAQLQADKARERSAVVAVEKIQEEERVLNAYEMPKEMERLRNDVRDKTVQVKLKTNEAKSKEVQFRADMESKQKNYAQEKGRLEDIQEQIKQCEIRAPKDGLVVYYIPESSRSGFGSRQSTIAQGEPVQEGQKLMRIPNLTHMLVNTKVHEALVSRVRPGQPAKVRVDAFPEKEFRASVKSVATVAAQNDWMSSDVKVYQTMVSIDESVEELGLKPGMSGAVTIYTDSRTDDALTVPIQAVLGSYDMGRKRKVWVQGSKGTEERDVVVGMSNEKMVEIKEGLNEGEQVVLNPRVLLSEKDRKMFGGGDRLLGKDNGPPGGYPKMGEGGGFPGAGAPGGGAPGGFPGKGEGMKGGEGGKGGGKGGKGAMPGGAGGPPGGFSKGDGKKTAPEGGKSAGAAQ